MYFLFQELEEVYDHLEEVLHQLEGATPGPRTAAIAQLAHKLLKVRIRIQFACRLNFVSIALLNVLKFCVE